MDSSKPSHGSSGEYKTPGAPLAPEEGPLQSIEAAVAWPKGQGLLHAVVVVVVVMVVSFFFSCCCC